MFTPTKPKSIPDCVTFNWFNSTEKDAVVCVCRVPACEATGTVSRPAWNPESESFRAAMHSFQENLYHQALDRGPDTPPSQDSLRDRVRSLEARVSELGFLDARLVYLEGERDVAARNIEAISRKVSVLTERLDAVDKPMAHVYDEPGVYHVKCTVKPGPAPCEHEPEAPTWIASKDAKNTCAKCGKRIVRDVGPWREDES